jgi:hypothetical protein
MYLSLLLRSASPFTFDVGVCFFPKDGALDAETVEMIWAQILQQVSSQQEFQEEMNSAYNFYNYTTITSFNLRH